MGFFSKLFGKSSPTELTRARQEELMEVFPQLRKSVAKDAAKERQSKEIYYGNGLSTANLDDKDEALAQNIKRLLLSASFHDSRDLRAFKNLSGQLEGMGNAIRSSGQERWYLIKRRVELLSGEHFEGLSQYYDLLGNAPEPKEKGSSEKGQKEECLMEERFYDFNVGTMWEFDTEFSDGEKRKSVFTVADRQTGRTIIEHDLFNPPDPGATASMDEIWYLEDGYVLWGSCDDEKMSPWWRIFKVGSKQGDTWNGPVGKGQALHLGIADVVVPAGRYPDALHIRLTDEDGKTHDFYYAPRVGLVKWETSGSSGTSVLKLRKFSLGP